MEYKSIALPIGVRYYLFLNDNSKFFVNASHVWDFVFDSRVEFSYGSDLEIQSTRNLALGLGYKYMDKYSFELRYSFDKELMGNYTGFGSKKNVISLLAGYTLF